MRASLPRFDSYEWQTFSYRHFTEEGEGAFARWVTLHDWTGILEAPDSNAKTAAYQAAVTEAMDNCFPVRTTKRKSTDLP